MEQKKKKKISNTKKTSKSELLEKGGVNSYCRFFFENKLEELSIEEQGFKLRLRRKKAKPAYGYGSRASIETDISSISINNQPNTAPANILSQAASNKASQKTSSTHTNNTNNIDAQPNPSLKDVPAPMTGTYYSAASPESSPYLNLGQNIAKGTPICILEAMKIMNEIESPIAGQVKEILFKNGENVRKGSVILRLLT